MSVARDIRNGAVGAVAGPGAVAALNRWDRRADRYWHRASSALLSLAWAQALGWGTGRQVACVVIGAVFGGGLTSPDVDNHPWWRAFDEAVPDRWAGRPLRHHGITHAVTITGPLAGILAMVGPWWLAMIPLQWVHHSLGDALIGLGGREDPGPPWVLWWHNRGLGRFRSGGMLARVLTVVCWPLIAFMIYTWGGGVS